jgi:hypothetical protein
LAAQSDGDRLSSGDSILRRAEERQKCEKPRKTVEKPSGREMMAFPQPSQAASQPQKPLTGTQISAVEKGEKENAIKRNGKINRDAPCLS